jgi:hypothetical protein
MNTKQLSKRYPMAFKSLPEPYQADDCIEFFEKDGTLYAKPSVGQAFLGMWVAFFDDGEWSDA